MVFVWVVPVAIAAGEPPSSSTADLRARECRDPVVPRRFHARLVHSIALSGDLIPSWARSRAIPRIVCWQGTDFKETFSEKGRDHHWRGIFAMTPEEMMTSRGPWMMRTRTGRQLSPKCFVSGWKRCPHIAFNQRATQQIIAGLRWIWLNYGTPKAAWQNIERTGRFNSYPRAGTANAPSGDPFDRCPVPSSYRDNFGAVRTVGGYHPHWGNDLYAPTGRPVRAPFDGLAVAHDDGWFAGMYVTVVGDRGYVRNAHLSRLGKLGYVKEGAIIGYVGATGDARGGPPHDHFEWHPWALGANLHVSPYGFRHIMDAIDPYPFLNKACGRTRVRVPSEGATSAD